MDDSSWNDTTVAMPGGNGSGQTIAIIVMAGLSMAGCVFIITSYLLWPELRTTTRQLLLFLSVADYLNSAGNAAGAACSQWCAPGDMDTDTLNCVVQSAVTTFASLASFFWTVCIAFFLYLYIAKGEVIKARKLVGVFHVLCWGVPIAITTAAIVCKALGNDDSLDSSGWCWVRRHPAYPKFPVSASAPDAHGNGGNSSSMVNVDNVTALANIVDDSRARTFWLMLAGKGWEVLAYLLTVTLYMGIKYHVYSEVSTISMVTSSFSSSSSFYSLAKEERKEHTNQWMKI